MFIDDIGIKTGFGKCDDTQVRPGIRKFVADHIAVVKRSVEGFD